MFQRFHEVKSLQESELSLKSHNHLMESHKLLIQVSSHDNENQKYKSSLPEMSRSIASSNIRVCKQNPTDIGNISSVDADHFRVKEETPSFSSEVVHSNDKYNAPAHAAALEVLSTLSSSKSFTASDCNSKLFTVLSAPNNCLKVDGKTCKGVEEIFSCNICNLVFKNGTQLKSHYWRHTGVKPFKCEVCQSSFTQLTNLKTHQRIHTGERPFECFECGANFTQISNLKTHQKLHTGEKPFVCDLCDAKFTQQSNLKSHRLIHTGERPFKCEFCSSTFVQSTHLRNHQRIHTNEKPYSCEHCGTSFRQLSNLRTHEKTHTGEKPYVCEECGTGFVQKSNLKAHRIKLHSIADNEPPNRRGRKGNHGGIGPFICPQCAAEYSSAANLRAHYRIHSGEKPFQCSVCFTSFTQKSNLKAHEMTHSDTRPYSCPDCPSSFKQKGNLRTHVLKKHEGATLNYSPCLAPILSDTLVHLNNIASSSVIVPIIKQVKHGQHTIFVINDNKNSDEPTVQIEKNVNIPYSSVLFNQ